MSNADEFLNTFNEIERHLRHMTNANKETPFHVLVREAGESHAAVRRFSNDLKEFADLRNAITHERTDGHVIAEPNDRAVADIKRVALLLINPPRVVPQFQKQVLALQTSDPVAEAVKSMLAHSFSQIPIYENQQFRGLLTTNAVARWLGACVAEDVFSLHETLIGSVLAHVEEENNYCFVTKNATLFQALHIFEGYHRDVGRLEAILITENGRATESLLGMITVWDLPAIYEELEGTGD